MLTIVDRNVKGRTGNIVLTPEERLNDQLNDAWKRARVKAVMEQYLRNKPSIHIPLVIPLEGKEGLDLH